MIRANTIFLKIIFVLIIIDILVSVKLIILLFKASSNSREEGKNLFVKRSTNPRFIRPSKHCWLHDLLEKASYTTFAYRTRRFWNKISCAYRIFASVNSETSPFVNYSKYCNIRYVKF